MKFLFVSFFALSVVTITTQQATNKPISQNKFTVISPYTIRRNKDFKFYVLGLDVTSDINIKIVLASNVGSYEIEKFVTLSNKNQEYFDSFDTSTIPFDITGYTLTVSSGDYTQSKAISFVTKENSIFIQLKKLNFKPGEKVQYRLFSIDSESNAFDQEKPITIILKDPANHDMETIRNVTFINGKYQGEFQLPSKPIFGTWTISVDYDFYDTPAIKTLEVNEYNLAMFTASLSVPLGVSYASSEVPITINAEYTFKQPVSGIATINITRNDGSVAFLKNISCSSKSTTFYLNFVKDLGLTRSDVHYAFTISMVFIDLKTNSKTKDSAFFGITPYIYTLEIYPEKFYHPGQPIKYTVVSKTLEGKPTPNVQVSVGVNMQVKNLTTGVNGTVESSYQTYSNFTMPLYFYTLCSICGGSITYVSSPFIKPMGGITLYLITDNPSFKDKVDIFAMTSEPIDYFYYFATSKGVLVDYRKIYLNEDGDGDNDPKTVKFSIYPDFSFTPLLNIYAFYYKKSESKIYDSNNLYIGFKYELPNYLKLNLQDGDENGNKVVKPGENITLLIQSKPLSTVSLSAIDQRVLLLSKNSYSQFNFTNIEVMYTLSKYNYGKPIAMEIDYYRANIAGLNLHTNVPLPTFSSSRKTIEKSGAIEKAKESPENFGSVAQAPVQIRKDFSEVFLYEDVEIDFDEENNANGSLVISRKVPDQITTYFIYGVSMNKYYGMGLPDILPTTTIFLPFFISLELPYSVKRYEILTLEIQVFNYLTGSQTAELTVFKDAAFDVINPSKNGWASSKGNPIQILKIASNQNVKVNLQIKPNIVGSIYLKVSAKSPLAGDTIEKVLKVIHEGVQRTITNSILIVVDSNNPAENQTLSCILPASAYNDSAEISATVTGDILGNALNNLEKLIVFPTGCGEQTMLLFVSDIAIYKYLNATNQLTGNLKIKLTQYLIGGYQNELKFQRTDGSFSYFGNNDANGSTSLTAYVIMYLNLVKSIIPINSTVIQNGLNFITAHQNSNGSFNEPGRIIRSEMQGSSGNGIALTAFITITLSTVAKDFPNVVASRDRAIKYIEQQLSSVTDTYSLAIIAYALTLANSANAATAFDRFYALRIETSTKIHWAIPNSHLLNYRPKSVDIEITAYGLNLLIARNFSIKSSIKIVNYLIGEINSFGGYVSTLDTAMALIALSNFAKIFNLKQNAVNLHLIPNTGAEIIVHINNENSFDLQKFSLDSHTRKMNINVEKGSSGIAIVSLICEFYEDPSKTIPSFNINLNFNNSCQSRNQVEVCITPISKNSTNLAIMEVRMPSGYYFYYSWWINNTNSGVSNVEAYEGNTVVIFYFDSIKSTGNCVALTAANTAIIDDLKPGSISVSDYYDTSIQGTKSFAIPTNFQNVTCTS
ncbi:hypothetical protein PVAND_016756 [Polypedilum vanderplanki]|uniref:Thioester-containing protein n=1 Tax=Polypedilum vanderplanki TaxID=319348 RepID=A0A9J6BG23_POLVA|nr:hypothetical protein PVAND_016756 [Polypedilum vanderplanki]